MLRYLYRSVSDFCYSLIANNDAKITSVEAQLISTRYSSRYILASEGYPALYAQFTNLCNKAGINKCPKLAVVESEIMNATRFYTGIIAVTTAALKDLKEDELGFLLSHEITHHLQRRTLNINEIFRSSTSVLTALAAVGIAGKNGFLDGKSIWGLFKTIALFEMIANLSNSLLGYPQRIVDRMLEQDADRGGLLLSGNLDAAKRELESHAKYVERKRSEIELKSDIPLVKEERTESAPHLSKRERISYLEHVQQQIDDGKLDHSRISRFW
ncbi:MAG: M48 family metalloprotease [Chitinophagales bacterium]|nr:M48 family metalloprotease [Chitinophagales bacterium]